MAKRKKNKSGFDNILISVGILFTIILGVIKIISGSGSWFRVFTPLIVVFIVIFLIKIIKSLINKL